ncbi:MAG: PG0541 family transporter-associated protein [Bacteroidales bacterium]
MKALFIVYNQVHTREVSEILDKHNIRGYTQWEDVMGRGSHRGEPHLGSHAWPAKNIAIVAIVEEQKVAPLAEALKELDSRADDQGLRAFVWDANSLV